MKKVKDKKPTHRNISKGIYGDDWCGGFDCGVIHVLRVIFSSCEKRWALHLLSVLTKEMKKRTK